MACCRSTKGGTGGRVARRSLEEYGGARPVAAWRTGGKGGGVRAGGAREGTAGIQGASPTWRARKRPAARRAAVRYGGARRPRAGAGQRAGLTGGQTASHQRGCRSDCSIGLVRPPVGCSQGEREGEKLEREGRDLGERERGKERSWEGFRGKGSGNFRLPTETSGRTKHNQTRRRKTEHNGLLIRFRHGIRSSENLIAQINNMLHILCFIKRNFPGRKFEDVT